MVNDPSIPRAPLPLTHPAVLVGTWLGSGLSPKAPGTMGSLAALPFAWVIHASFGGMGLLAASILAFFIGWYATHVYMRHTDATDPKEIVVDEVAALWLLLSALGLSWQAYALGFALFRFFDVLKPWPVSWADRTIHGAFGVMLDDILAALYPIAIFAAVCLLSGAAGLELCLPHWLGV